MKAVLAWLLEGWGPWSRRGWACVALSLALGLLSPVVVRWISPSLASVATYYRTPPVRPQLRAPKGGPAVVYPDAGSSDGTSWITSARVLASRESAEGQDPWGRRWLYDARPTEETELGRSLLEADPVWEKLRGGRALLPYSRGPDGVDDGGAGDDVRLQPLLGLHSDLAHSVAWSRPIAWALAGLLAWLLVSARMLGPPQEGLVREALASLFLASLPIVAIVWACVLNVNAIESHSLVKALRPLLVLDPAPMLAISLSGASYLLVLYCRARLGMRLDPTEGDRPLV